MKVDYPEIMTTDIEIIDGDRGKNYPQKKDFYSEGYCLFLNTGNIKDDKFYLSNCDFITENKDQSLRKGKLKRKDIVLTTRGTVGSVAYYSDNIKYENIRINSGMVIIRCQNDFLPEYLYQVLKSDNVKKQFELLSSGAAQPQLPIKSLIHIRIPKTDISNQYKISEILTNYDDLIDNNLRRIELLERSAELLYKEWFVNLRFPGYEGIEIDNGVPKGWKIIPLNEICEKINYGYTASANAEKIGPKYLRITDIVPDIINWDNVPHCDIPENKKESFLLKEGDIVVARTGATVGYAKRINKRIPETVFASYLVRLRIKKEYSNIFLGHIIESESYKNFIKSRVIGAAQPNANAKIISSIKILYSSEYVLQKFDEIISSINEQKEILSIQNLKLAKARDLLLPKLINGEIEV